ncbi:MAG: SDR family NAD(P)-dependent oxidoreductase [Solirubrobacterales bacterium]
MRSVLLTGAATGIGRATALRLDAAGWRVFAGVRREEDADSLRESASPVLTPVRLDVTDPDQIAAAAELVARARRRPAGPRKQRRDRRAEPAGDDPDRRLSAPAGGQPDRPGGGHPRAARPDPRRSRPRRLHRLDRRSRRLPPDRRLPRRQVRDHYSQAIAAYRQAIRRTAERDIPPEKVAAAVERALSSSRPRARYLVGLDARLQARIRPLVPTPVWDRPVAMALGL